MSPTQKKRAILVVTLVAGISISAAFILNALSQNINLFYSPKELHMADVGTLKTIRVGGMVVENSVKRQPELGVDFVITDYEDTLSIHYNGILPDLFREGQGIVALGQLNEQGVFVASQVLAKHDEKYMPPEVAKTLVLTQR